MKETDFWDHAHSKNPFTKFLVSKYFKCLDELLKDLTVISLLDVGCGSGYVTNYLNNLLKPSTTIGIDNNPNRLKLAKERFPTLDFREADGLSIPANLGYFHLVACTQVLEHIETTGVFLEELHRAGNYVFISVPNNVPWRIGNLLRGKYWSGFGQPPGHIKDFSKGSLHSLLSEFFLKVEVRRCWIWILALCER
jgi:2-polyprenyl-3-methyl-5-hydroxy-6-metoxy-1,4-benzoquinol methylase